MISTTFVTLPLAQQRRGVIAPLWRISFSYTGTILISFSYTGINDIYDDDYDEDGDADDLQ